MARHPNTVGSTAHGVKRSPAPALVLASCLLTTLVLLATGILWPSDPLAQERTSPTPDSPRLLAESASTEGPQHTGQRDALASESPANTATPLPPTAPDTAPRDSYLVRVVDAQTGAPVPDAEVATDDDYGSGLSVAEAIVYERLDRFARAVRFGLSARTDRRGVAVLRGFGGLVLARKGNLAGHRLVRLADVPPTGVEVRVAPQQTATVHVRDSTTQPVADVPIGMNSVQGHDGGRDTIVQTNLVGLTDAAGKLSLTPSLQLEHAAPLRSVELFVFAPGLTHLRHAWRGDTTAAEFTLEPHGRLQVRAVDVAGKPLPDAPRWSVSVWLADEAPDTITCTQLGSEGVATFTHVRVGARYFVMLQCAGESPSQTIAGPGSPGEVTTTTLTLGRPRLSARGRLLDSTGQPVVGAELAAVVEGAADRAPTLTDASGRFFVRLRGPQDAAAVRMHLEARRGTQILGHTAPFDLLPGHELDLDPAQLLPWRTLARGELIEERPRPAGLRLTIEELQGRSWRHTSDITAQLDETSSFTIAQAQAPRGLPLRLVVRAPGCAPIEPIPFQPGDQLRLVLKPGGRFVARVLLDPATTRFIAAAELDLVLTSADDQDLWLRPELRDGEFWFETHSCPLGTFTLRLEPTDASLDLGQIEGVRVDQSGEPDPRLWPWDLRSSVRLMTVRTVDASGAPSPLDGNLLLRWPGHEWEDAGHMEGGSLQVLVPRRPVDVYLQPDEQAGLLRAGQEGDPVFVVPALQPAHIAGLPKLREDAKVNVVAVPSDSWAASRGLPDEASPLGKLDYDAASGTATLLVAEPADVEFVFTAFGEDRPRRELTTVTVQVAPGQRVTATLPAAAIGALAPFVR